MKLIVAVAILAGMCFGQDGEGNQIREQSTSAKRSGGSQAPLNISYSNSINPFDGQLSLSVPLFSISSFTNFAFSPTLNYHSRASIKETGARLDRIPNSIVADGWSFGMAQRIVVDHASTASLGDDRYHYVDASGSGHELFNSDPASDDFSIKDMPNWKVHRTKVSASAGNFNFYKIVYWDLIDRSGRKYRFGDDILSDDPNAWAATGYTVGYEGTLGNNIIPTTVNRPSYYYPTTWGVKKEIDLWGNAATFTYEQVRSQVVHRLNNETSQNTLPYYTQQLLLKRIALPNGFAISVGWESFHTNEKWDAQNGAVEPDQEMELLPVKHITSVMLLSDPGKPDTDFIKKVVLSKVNYLVFDGGNGDASKRYRKMLVSTESFDQDGKSTHDKVDFTYNARGLLVKAKNEGGSLEEYNWSLTKGALPVTPSNVSYEAAFPESHINDYSMIQTKSGLVVNHRTKTGSYNKRYWGFYHWNGLRWVKDVSDYYDEQNGRPAEWDRTITNQTVYEDMFIFGTTFHNNPAANKHVIRAYNLNENTNSWEKLPEISIKSEIAALGGEDGWYAQLSSAGGVLAAFTPTQSQYEHLRFWDLGKLKKGIVQPVQALDPSGKSYFTGGTYNPSLHYHHWHDIYDWQHIPPSMVPTQNGILVAGEYTSSLAGSMSYNYYTLNKKANSDEYYMLNNFNEQIVTDVGRGGHGLIVPTTHGPAQFSRKMRKAGETDDVWMHMRMLGSKDASGSVFGDYPFDKADYDEQLWIADGEDENRVRINGYGLTTAGDRLLVFTRQRHTGNHLGFPNNKGMLQMFRFSTAANQVFEREAVVEWPGGANPAFRSQVGDPEVCKDYYRFHSLAFNGRIGALSIRNRSANVVTPYTLYAIEPGGFDAEMKPTSWKARVIHTTSVVEQNEHFHTAHVSIIGDLIIFSHGYSDEDMSGNNNQSQWVKVFKYNENSNQVSSTPVLSISGIEAKFILKPTCYDEPDRRKRTPFVPIVTGNEDRLSILIDNTIKDYFWNPLAGAFETTPGTFVVNSVEAKNSESATGPVPASSTLTSYSYQEPEFDNGVVFGKATESSNRSRILTTKTFITPSAIGSQYLGTEVYKSSVGLVKSGVSFMFKPDENIQKATEKTNYYISKEYGDMKLSFPWKTETANNLAKVTKEWEFNSNFVPVKVTTTSEKPFKVSNTLDYEGNPIQPPTGILPNRVTEEVYTPDQTAVNLNIFDMFTEIKTGFKEAKYPSTTGTSEVTWDGGKISSIKTSDNRVGNEIIKYFDSYGRNFMTETRIGKKSLGVFEFTHFEAEAYGYEKKYPIASVSNSRFSDFAYTSFENGELEDAASGKFPQGLGSNTGSIVARPSRTGEYSYLLGNNQNVTSRLGLSQVGKPMVFTFWARMDNAGSSTLEVRLGGKTKVVPVSGKEWRLVHVVVNTVAVQLDATVKNLGASSVLIDELRVVPKEANLTSSTFDIRKDVITSTTDLTGQTKFTSQDASIRYTETVEDGNAVFGANIFEESTND